MDATPRVWTCEACDEQEMTIDQMRRYERRAVQMVLREAKVSDQQAGAIVRYARKALGLKQSDLAALLDVAPETVSRWETGNSAPPDRTTRLALLALLDSAEQGTFDRMRQALREETPTERLEVPSRDHAA